MSHELPAKQRTDKCTLMYTSGTTGEPKGVILTNEAIMAEVLSMEQMLELTDKVVKLHYAKLVLIFTRFTIVFFFSSLESDVISLIEWE